MRGISNGGIKMDKHIGILTFHYVNNYGAVLQAYALRKVINSFSGCQAEIINYVPDKYIYFISPDDADKQRRKGKSFETFLSKHCGINTPMISSVTGNEKDVYVVGSDQVWNIDIPIVAADYEYFFPHLDENAKRIAYSASIGMESERMNRKLFQKYLPKFQRISVREKEYVEMISELSGKKCEHTLDPALLLDEIDYLNLIEKPNTIEEPYLLYFCYGTEDNGLAGIETVNTLSRKYNLSIKHTFSSETSLTRKLLVKDGGDVMQSGIGEFLWYVKNAQIVVTNSFHVAVFSILFKKPFYTYLYIRRSRQENLMELLQLEDRIVKGYLSPDRLNIEIDYKAVFSILEREKKRSLSYLKDAIGVV